MGADGVLLYLCHVFLRGLNQKEMGRSKIGAKKKIVPYTGKLANPLVKQVATARKKKPPTTYRSIRDHETTAVTRASVQEVVGGSIKHHEAETRPQSLLQLQEMRRTLQTEGANAKIFETATLFKLLDSVDGISEDDKLNFVKTSVEDAIKIAQNRNVTQL